MSDKPVMTITLDGECNIDLIHQIEQNLDKALVSVGFARTETNEGESVTIRYYQFGKAM